VFTSGRAGFTYSGLEATVRACTETPFRLPDRLECHSRLAPATRGDLCSGQQLKRGWRCVRPHLQALADEAAGYGDDTPTILLGHFWARGARLSAWQQGYFNLAEPQIHMSQILVTPGPDPNVRNLKNDKAKDDEEARKKADLLLARIRGGDDFSMLAQNYSEDPNSAQNGGDLGFIPESALERANAELRKAILTVRAGETTGVLRTNEGYRILKVISREPAGQRDLTDPKVQQTIRDTLVNRKDQLLRAAYYEVARDEAKVANYFAEKISGTKPKK